MGRSAAMKELLGLLLRNLKGAAGIMEAEKQRSYERDDELRYGQSHLIDILETMMDGMLTMHKVGMLILLQRLRTLLNGIGMAKGLEADPILPASKWSRDDDDGSDGEDKKGSHGLGLGYSSSGSENVGPERADAEVATDADVFSHPDISMSEEYRQKLRRLEVAVMEYRESLEERASKLGGHREEGCKLP
ncbi:hypothetical protein HPP92_016881 [Vanilla planifolia]|uniref:Uncharacterized protein n=1 Tax=Vanilla planifolia TaxID=51239 RepID=A0A835QL03_VANPL|nr:hypothetical protein HPP92_016881 [Vanilla planifolia]